MATGSSNIEQVATLMANLDICMLTTRSTDGGLHSRPMSNNGEVEFDGDVWFFSHAESRKVREIQSDARVTLTFSAAERGIWLALEGDAEIVRNVEKKRALWLDELAQWFDGPDDAGVVLIKVRALRVEQFGAQEGVIELA